MAHYYVKSPLTGKWFDAPYLGMVHHKVQAHHYWEGDPHLRFLVSEAMKVARVKLILRQVPEENKSTVADLAAQFEKDMEADPPVPVLDTCPECQGMAAEQPLYDCSTCKGEGWVVIGHT